MKWLTNLISKLRRKQVTDTPGAVQASRSMRSLFKKEDIVLPLSNNLLITVASGGRPDVSSIHTWVQIWLICGAKTEETLNTLERCALGIDRFTLRGALGSMPFEFDFIVQAEHIIAAQAAYAKLKMTNWGVNR